MKAFQCKPASIPKARWAAYAAAGAATALGGTPSSAEAEVHYSGLVNHDFAHGRFAGQLDPGVTVDLSVGTGTQVGNYTFRFGFMHIRNPSGDTIGDFVGTRASYAGFYLLELPRGVSLPLQHVSNYCRFYSTCNCGTCFGGYIGGSGRFRDRRIGFIGFAFNHGAGLQYGWARVQTSGPPNYRFRLVDYAWGDPGDRIRTGQISLAGNMVDAVTESGSVGLLALGAVGLLAWRKSRSRAARQATTRT